MSNLSKSIESPSSLTGLDDRSLKLVNITRLKRLIFSSPNYTMILHRIQKYFSKHVAFGNAVHAIGGFGVGLLVYQYISGYKIIAIGLALVALSILGHVYAIFAKG